MTWKLWTFAVIMAIEAVISLARVGRERPTMTLGNAVTQVLEIGIIVWLVLS